MYQPSGWYILFPFYFQCRLDNLLIILDVIIMRTRYIAILVLLLGFLVSCGTENKPTYKITTTVSLSEGGTITLSPSSGVYSEDETVTIQGTPSNGWRFVRWEGDWSGETNPSTITMNKNYSVVGVFERRNYPLTITIEGNGEAQERVIQQKTTDYPYQTIVRN